MNGEVWRTAEDMLADALDSRSMLCLDVVIFDGNLMHDLIVYWPAQAR
jgi:hypothetical protein